MSVKTLRNYQLRHSRAKSLASSFGDQSELLKLLKNDRLFSDRQIQINKNSMSYVLFKSDVVRLKYA